MSSDFISCYYSRLLGPKKFYLERAGEMGPSNPKTSVNYL